MKKTFIAIAVIASLVFQVGAVNALTSDGARQDWLNTKQARLSADVEYRQAKLDYATDKTPEKEQKLIDAAQKLLNAALDEAEAWLIWKNLEAKERSGVPESIKKNIENDVNKNLAKIEGLRTDVENIKTRLDVGLVFLKMAGSYVELLADVARNTGAMWVVLGDKLVETARDYESNLREAAEKVDDNAAMIEKLDIAKSEIKTAEDKIRAAESAYKKVVLPGTPLIKFAEGNEYLRQARINLMNAHTQLAHVFNLITSGK